ncbi:hypothetical protein CBLAS_0840 [Campylobacter blaseri]|uniref:Uncharacterized protein n=1 Tax=Campylobacter blaseri TaxID=2042961 RepID=A0A2P8R2K0_9BACT|nr:hypothetical protein [Campylobacter blaseri]PSM52723.1 hypothetical protein CQ405_03055 [Campylobacter blaseri]PSM54371.1 hypothetical protein CRN67_03055 [Campylobacter blaseri]QKF86027.1 hypothetical protein CBLAS_0840 [Campylobacter blaseri]
MKELSQNEKEELLEDLKRTLFLLAEEGDPIVNLTIDEERTYSLENQAKHIKFRLNMTDEDYENLYFEIQEEYDKRHQDYFDWVGSKQQKNQNSK